ncbi:MAG: hypothetical protein GX096_10075 [Clostridiales bacterium]|nr:hypothetical protein [Clostridiales bacterium]
MTIHNESASGTKTKKTKRSIWDFFSVMKDGRLKSTFLIYSFTLGFVFLAFYLLCYVFLLGPIDGLLAVSMPLLMKNLVEALIPTIAGTVLCLAFHLWVKDKRIVPAGYLWLSIYMIVLLLLILAVLDSADRVDFLRLYAMFVPLPIILGGGTSFIIYKRYCKKRNEN